MSRVFYKEILKQAIPTSFDRDIFESEREWKRSLDNSEVRYQWDPDRDLSLRRLEHRALQLGIRGSVVQSYVNDWILDIEEVTKLAHDINNAVKNKLKELPKVPEEKVYRVNREIQKSLRITDIQPDIMFTPLPSEDYRFEKAESKE